MYVSLFGICRQYVWRNKLKLEKKIVQNRSKLTDESEMKFYLLYNISIDKSQQWKRKRNNILWIIINVYLTVSFYYSCFVLYTNGFCNIIDLAIILWGALRSLKYKKFEIALFCWSF